MCFHSSERPYSDKYEMLKPGGTIGLKLGILGTVLFFIIFLYAFRKLIPWLDASALRVTGWIFT